MKNYLFFIFIFIIFNYYLLNYNLIPNLPLNNNLIDCNKIILKDFYQIENNLFIKFFIKNFIEYPKEFSPYLLNLIGENKFLNFNSNNNLFINFSFNNNLFLLNYQIPILGNYNLSLYCQKILIQKKEFQINLFNNEQIFSTINFLNKSILKFQNICLNNNNSLNFFTNFNII